MITFDEFKSDRQVFAENTVNEGIFGKLTALFSKFVNMFKDTAKLSQGVDAAMKINGTKSIKFIPKQAKPNESFVVKMVDPKNAAATFSMALTKLADLPDGSGLFQISGTTSPEMLKALVNSVKVEDLAKNNVMAIISQNGMTKGMPMTMRLLKNIIPGDKDYVTKTVVDGIVPSVDVEKAMATIKPGAKVSI